jgi:aminoglycoside phosphotransferase (APT) family kinase protein
MSSSPGLAAADAVAGVAEHLRLEGQRYFPELMDPPQWVRRTGSVGRDASCLHVFELVGEGGIRRRVVVKISGVRRLQVGAAEPPLRPRLAPPTEPATRSILEYRAMRAAEERFAGRAIAGLRAVRVLDHLPTFGALLLEAVEAPTLLELTWRRGAGTRRCSTVDLLGAYRSAGRWLAEFHRFRPPPHVVARRGRGREVIGAIATYVDHLGAATGAGVLRRVEALVVAAPEALFPAEYDLVWSHGDAAPRNVFVWSPRPEVAMFDLVGRWSTPPHEDVAYFLTALRCGGRQILTQGLAGLGAPVAQAEAAFLSGYGVGRPLPRGPLLAYQLLVILDRWSAARGNPPISSRTSFASAYRRLVDRFFVRQVTAILDELGTARVSRREIWSTP